MDYVEQSIISFRIEGSPYIYSRSLKLRNLLTLRAGSKSASLVSNTLDNRETPKELKGYSRFEVLGDGLCLFYGALSSVDKG